MRIGSHHFHYLSILTVILFQDSAQGYASVHPELNPGHPLRGFYSELAVLEIYGK